MHVRQCLQKAVYDSYMQCIAIGNAINRSTAFYINNIKCEGE